MTKFDPEHLIEHDIVIDSEAIFRPDPSYRIDQRLSYKNNFTSVARIAKISS